MAIPLLVYVVGIPVQKASAMSLIVVGYSALFGAWQESRQKRVHIPAALVFSLTGMLGAWIGAQGHQLVHETVVLFLFGHLLLFMSVWTFFQPQKDQGNEVPTGCAKHFSWPCAFKASAIGWGVGLLTGFFWDRRWIFNCASSHGPVEIPYPPGDWHILSYHCPHFHRWNHWPFETGSLRSFLNGIGITWKRAGISFWI